MQEKHFTTISNFVKKKIRCKDKWNMMWIYNYRTEQKYTSSSNNINLKGILTNKCVEMKRTECHVLRLESWVGNNVEALSVEDRITLPRPWVCFLPYDCTTLENQWRHRHVLFIIHVIGLFLQYFYTII